MLGPASVALGLEHFCGAVHTGRTPVKMLAVCTAESSHAPYPYSHWTQQMNHNSHMFWKRTCSLAAASPLLFQADSHSGNRGRRAAAAALKQRAASPAEGGQRQRSAHPLQQAEKSPAPGHAGIYTPLTRRFMALLRLKPQIPSGSPLLSKVTSTSSNFITTTSHRGWGRLFFPFPASKKVHYLL